MKNDKLIKKLIISINDNTTRYLSSPNADAFTDHVIETIVSQSKELERLHESRFEKG